MKADAALVLTLLTRKLESVNQVKISVLLLLHNVSSVSRL